jgi:hypothetical protein
LKKKSRIDIEREIVSRVKREMDKPRLAESVRNDFRTPDAPAIERPAARLGERRSRSFGCPPHAAPIS